MCHRKLPPSFWNSSHHHRSPLGTGSEYNRDYFASWYALQNSWQYHFPPQSYSGDLSRSLQYPTFESSSKLTPSYSSLMFRSGLDSRNPKYEMSKLTDSLSASGAYYGLSRFGSDNSSSVRFGSDHSSNLPYEPSSSCKY